MDGVRTLEAAESYIDSLTTGEQWTDGSHHSARRFSDVIHWNELARYRRLALEVPDQVPAGRRIEFRGGRAARSRFEVRRFRPNLVIRPADPQILRTAAQQNKAHVGVYASVVRTGTIRCGDTVRIAD